MARNLPGFIGAFAIVIVLAFIIISPILNTVLAACILAYLFYPLYRRLNERIMNDNASAILVTFFVMLLLVLPAAFVANALTREAIHVVNAANQPSCEKSAICVTLSYLSNVNPDLPSNLQATTNSVADSFAGYLKGQASLIFFSVSGIIFSLSILFFILYYLLKDGAGFFKRIMQVIPLADAHKKELSKKVQDVTRAVLLGNFMVAIVQAIAAFAGFSVLGVPNPVLWGIITFFASLIPLGAFIVWFPASLIMGVDGYLSGNGQMLFRAVLLFLYGAFFISLVDNWLKPKLVSDQAKIHPAFVIVGIVGGISVFGFVGVFIGPLILAILLIFIEMAEKEGII